MSSYALYQNKAIDMKTGEGKSLSSIIPLILKTLENDEYSYFLSINNYLLKRDFDNFKPIYDYFNIETILNFSGILNNNNPNKIVYTTSLDLLSVNMMYYQNLYYKFKISEKSFFLIDEADLILIDNALQPVVISDEIKIDKELLLKIIKIGDTLVPNVDYILDNSISQCHLNNEVFDKIENKYNIQNLPEYKNLNLIFLIENYLQFKHFYKKDIDYIVENNNIYYINPKTGNKENFHTTDYMKQFIEINENLPVSNKKIIIQKNTYQSFFKDLKNKAAMSGTTIYEKKYFNYYGFDIITIPLNFKKQLIIKKNELYYNKNYNVL